MSFDVPNSSQVSQDPTYAGGALAKWYRSDVQIIEAALEGVRPISGCQLVTGANPGTVKVNSGVAIFATSRVLVGTQDNLACMANSDATGVRWILYEIDNTGTVQVNLGTPQVYPSIPEPPTPTATRCVVGAVLVPPASTANNVDSSLAATNGNGKIVDKRAMRSPSTQMDLFKPTYLSVSDGVTQGVATTWNSGAINLNTLTGTQTVTLTTTTGLPTAGAIVVTHTGTDYVITYNGISGNNLQNCTMVSDLGTAVPSVVMANGDAAGNTKIITSATAAWDVNAHVNSFVTGSTDLVLKGANAAIVKNMGTVPGGTSKWMQINTATTGAHTAQTISVAQTGFSPTALPGVRTVKIISINPGGGGKAGNNAATTTTDTDGGGGGGPGGVSIYEFAGADLTKNGSIGAFTVSQGGRGGLGVTSGAGSAGVDGAGNSWASSVNDIIALGSGGKGATGTTGGLQGLGTETPLGLSFAGGNGAIGSSSTAATVGYSPKVNGGNVAGGGGGGGALHGSGSVLIASSGGGAGGSQGFFFNGNNGGGGGAAGVNGGPGGDFLLAAEMPNSAMTGSGGGGGGGRNTNNTTGGNGGQGGLYGGGGGGGGNGVGTGKSGDGGDGADGCILFIQYA
jgi:hypothetical protein